MYLNSQKLCQTHDRSFNRTFFQLWWSIQKKVSEYADILTLFLISYLREIIFSVGVEPGNP